MVAKLDGLWHRYTRSNVSHPIVTQSLTAAACFFVGDILAQALQGQAYDAPRTIRLVIFGLCVLGPVGHTWYSWVDKHITKVVEKVALDQLVWAPIFTCVFFAFNALLSGAISTVNDEIRGKLLHVLLVNWTFWPAAHVLNFSYVPPQYRILYISLLSIPWNAFLSWMANS